jgi:hypothetical protein
LKLHTYVKKYSTIQKNPRYFHIFLIIPTILRRGIEPIRSFFWFVRSGKSNETFYCTKKAPKIDFVWVSEKKDFKLLPFSIEYALKYTLNEIESILIVVPDHQIEACRDLIKKLNLRNEIQILGENLVIPMEIRTSIEERFPRDYGWILQQFVKLQVVLNSKSKGVLLMDSDTFLLEKVLWLDEDQVSLFRLAEWKHAPYFKFLKEIGLNISKPKFSFVAHHMIMRPTILSEAILYLGHNNMIDFLKYILSRLNAHNVKSLSIDYEFYGNFVLLKYPEKIKMTKFCNLSLNSNLSDNSIKSLISRVEHTNKYRSLSLHSWNSF